MAFFETKNVLREVMGDFVAQIEAYADKTVIWFGYTPIVDVLQRVLARKRIDYVVDNDNAKWGLISGDGTIIAPPSDVINAHKNDSVIMLFSNYSDSIMKQLESYGYEVSNIIRFQPPLEISEKYANTAFFDYIKGLRQMTLRELQLCELGILRELKNHCDKNGLRYYLAGGTCFGAANYKGFVPWDDDIDVYLPYEDYCKLISDYSKNVDCGSGICCENSDYEILHYSTCDDFFWPYAQLADKRTLNIYASFPICSIQHVGIDIIPLTGWPQNKDEIDYRIRLNKMLENKWRAFFYSKGIVEVQDERASISAKRYDLPFETSENVATAVELWGGEEQWILPHSAFEYGETLEFEGERFSVMKDWGEYLRLRHRKYEGKPQSEIQVNHPIRAFYSGAARKTVELDY